MRKDGEGIIAGREDDVLPTAETNLVFQHPFAICASAQDGRRKLPVHDQPQAFLGRSVKTGEKETDALRHTLCNLVIILSQQRFRGCVPEYW